MEQFETKVIINKDTWRELRRYWKPLKEKMRVAILSVVLAIVGVFYFMFFENTVIGTLAIALSIIAPLTHHYNFRQATKLNEKRAAESAGGVTHHELTTSFTENEILVRTVINGSIANIKYSAIKRSAKTERLYALITQENQFIIVNREQLILEQKEDEFLRFIQEKCESVALRNLA